MKDKLRTQTDCWWTVDFFIVKPDGYLITTQNPTGTNTNMNFYVWYGYMYKFLHVILLLTDR
jgi:hypothetical protein